MGPGGLGGGIRRPPDSWVLEVLVGGGGVRGRPKGGGGKVGGQVGRVFNVLLRPWWTGSGVQFNIQISVCHA